MPETESQEQPVEASGPRIEFSDLTPDFARELVGDLSSLGEAFNRGAVGQMDFLEFCIAHLNKINDYVKSRA